MAEFLEQNPRIGLGRWILSILFVLFSWWGLGSVASLGLMEFWQVTFFTGSSLYFFLAVHAGFVLFFISTGWVQIFILKQKLSLLLGMQPFRWERFTQAFCLWSGLLILGTLIETLIFPQSISFQAMQGEQFAYIVAVCLLTPIQVLAEEIFFRTLVPRFVYRLWPQPVFAVIFAALCFTGVHLQNPEMGSATAWLVMGYYFLFALLAGFLVLTDKGLERAMGWHLATNLFAFLILSYEPSPIRTPALFHTRHFDPAWNFAQFALMAGVGYAILWWLDSREQEVFG
ncbi:hypothetical protein COW36_20385 [bacterium (Candidatus Blackallbacteria) CG17_big_fil_post_rev_8_21_14_2_50_48_46]|uniref:CAAX prenyl protease 2/Lysostaphin resistance protein A-like domain-containing protein n=1 Tax=bacterium (Candidatus Blackallbacteria) CG17_big_fil_post_rev_8_21_14_2_50_48_46 TaxID=2014261 RepID=A0A2M7FZE1_9BACT|nr:MAG: hypothetical protein COW64_22710 [bacterium (Candidatus Blackallbacteria) CG18_big_fil_WC_8_21_14_2_50_49_26]PIW14763.1 MAG: hypothetical protein COW36_20385 [bacterium (Candidatus Blackallbacteria) CG17_big_fil_post_rev_8_21_14_2_50_48_46]PIW50865.1 MAG: hypothetical protein COW20_01200 [bacterium (Candidatus Blackallbacteria) CG13_big_fil_rev_8_21_14_2_50_49_14]